jgi:hypothetical protein
MASAKELDDGFALLGSGVTTKMYMRLGDMGTNPAFAQRE